MATQVKPNYKVKQGDLLTVEEPEPEELDVVAEDLDLDIVYEDKDVLVVNKPRGMVVHPAPGHATGTVVNGLMYQVQGLIRHQWRAPSRDCSPDRQGYVWAIDGCEK